MGVRRNEVGQHGHLLVGLMVLVAVMLILLTATAQSWTFLVRRDAEAELIFRGEQYAKAIQFYRKETNAFPLQLKTLMRKGPHRHRFIRKLFKDPLSDDGEWGLLYLSPTGKGYINPYATRPTDAFVAGGLGQAPGAAGGFISPFAKSGSKGLTGQFGQQAAAQAPGYSAQALEQFQVGEGRKLGLPIVGVVHRKKESGLKIYRNQPNLNDWAFTLLAEGQRVNVSGSVAAPLPSHPLAHGVGDVQNPIFHSGHPPPGLSPPEGEINPIKEIQKKLKQQAAEEEERRRQEEEAAAAEEQEEDEYADEAAYSEDEEEEAAEEAEREASGDEEDADEEDGGDEDEQAEPDPDAAQDPNEAALP